MPSFNSRKQKESAQLMYLLSTQLGNLKVQLISILKFICQKGEL
jgi:hypothetical protein